MTMQLMCTRAHACQYMMTKALWNTLIYHSKCVCVPPCNTLHFSQPSACDKLCVCLCVCVHTHIGICMYTCIHVYIYIYVCVCVYLWSATHMHTHWRSGRWSRIRMRRRRILGTIIGWVCRWASTGSFSDPPVWSGQGPGCDSPETIRRSRWTVSDVLWAARFKVTDFPCVATVAYMCASSS